MKIKSTKFTVISLLKSQFQLTPSRLLLQNECETGNRIATESDYDYESALATKITSDPNEVGTCRDVRDNVI